MQDMFDEARKEGLWLYCSYQDLWFSPDELEAAQAEGRFRWGRTNWTLRDPKEKLVGLIRAEASAAQAVIDFRERLKATK